MLFIVILAQTGDYSFQFPPSELLMNGGIYCYQEFWHSDFALSRDKHNPSLFGSCKCFFLLLPFQKKQKKTAPIKHFSWASAACLHNGLYINALPHPACYRAEEVSVSVCSPVPNTQHPHTSAVFVTGS